MSLLQHFEIIQRIFYLFGLAPFYSSVENRNRKTGFRNVPVVVSFLSNICVALLQFISFYLQTFGQIVKLINYSYFGSVLLANTIANWQCWYSQSVYENIIYRIEQMEILCNFKFSRKISYKYIRRRYIVNFGLIIGCFSLSAALVLHQAWYIGSNPKRAIALACLTLFKEFMMASAILHFTLYADVVRLFIAELNNQIRFSPICFYVSTKVAFLKDVKLMHMDMFLLMKQVTDFFGWNLLLLMIHYLILITYCLYWTFLTIQQNGQPYSIAESMASLAYCIICVIVLVNSCEYCALETMHLMENVEIYNSYASDNNRLSQLKIEFFEQIRNFPFDVTAKGYFTFNRRLLTTITSSCCTYVIVLMQFFLSSTCEPSS